MADVANQQFKEQTPNTYKWALGASGVVAVATTAALSIAPEVAGYAMAGLMFFILLMFIVVNLEIGTTANANPLAQNCAAPGEGLVLVCNRRSHPGSDIDHVVDPAWMATTNINCPRHGIEEIPRFHQAL
ncbi:hypothetical protein ACVWZ3_006530 [Bradyrhizobium sp. i1.3.6]